MKLQPNLNKVLKRGQSAQNLRHLKPDESVFQIKLAEYMKSRINLLETKFGESSTANGS